MEWCYVVCSHERLRGRRPAQAVPESRADRHPARAGARRSSSPRRGRQLGASTDFQRRGWDSNPRGGLTPPTRFPVALLKPLGHLSGVSARVLARGRAGQLRARRERRSRAAAPRTPRSQHAGAHLGAVVEGGLGEHVEDAARGARPSGRGRRRRPPGSGRGRSPPRTSRRARGSRRASCPAAASRPAPRPRPGSRGSPRGRSGRGAARARCPRRPAARRRGRRRRRSGRRRAPAAAAGALDRQAHQPLVGCWRFVCRPSIRRVCAQQQLRRPARVVRKSSPRTQGFVRAQPR